MSGKDGKLRLLDLDNLSGQGQAGHTGGEIGPVVNVPQGGRVLTQPAVWRNPSDGSTWVFVANGRGTAALKLTLGTDATPRLTPQWITTTPGTSPLIANGVLFSAAGTRVGAYDAITGAALWQDASLATLHWQTPAVASGRLFIADGSGHLNAYA